MEKDYLVIVLSALAEEICRLKDEIFMLETSKQALEEKNEKLIAQLSEKASRSI